MNSRRLIRNCGYGLTLTACLATTGCFSIEQEVFLNADGSGELVVHVAMPDLPEDMMKSPAGAASKKSPGQDIEEMKKELTTSLPPTVKIKQVKEVRQNGALGFYIVFAFKELKDVDSILANFGKGSLKDSDIKGDSQWAARLEKAGGKTTYTCKFLLDLETSATKKEGPAKTEPAKEPAVTLDDDFTKQIMPLLLGTMRLRFVLHTPAPITETNADIVLNERTAVWNCSFIAFWKDKKKPIEMRATY
ncbi:MAG TPA: hypothetical protein VJH03_12890 [Blastocatellia bacterium]|nr:hypothetical protein [Blastocatellia bacterium]